MKYSEIIIENSFVDKDTFKIFITKKHHESGEIEYFFSDTNNIYYLDYSGLKIIGENKNYTIEKKINYEVFQLNGFICLINKNALTICNDIDTETFKKDKGFFFDKNHIYDSYLDILPNIESKGFIALSTDIFKNDKNVYFIDNYNYIKKIECAHVGTFEKLSSSCNTFYVDKYNVYNGDKILSGICPYTLLELGHGFYLDKNNAYYLNKYGTDLIIIEGLDPKNVYLDDRGNITDDRLSYTIVEKSYFDSRDKLRKEYYLSKV